MHIPILAESEVRALRAEKKEELVEAVAEQLTHKFDRRLFDGCTGTLRLSLVGAFARTFTVQVGREDITLVSDVDAAGPAESFVRMDVDDFLVHALVCQGYGLGPNLYDQRCAQITGSRGLAERVFTICGMLPTAIIKGLRELESVTFPEHIVVLASTSDPGAVAHVRSKRPFAVRDGFSEIASCRWDLDYLKRSLGDAQYGSSPLASAIEQAERPGEEGHPVYIAAVPPKEMVRALPSIAIGTSRFVVRETFLSGAGALARLHRDFVDGITAVLLGPRKFYFFAPGESSNLYPFPGKEADSQCCHVIDPRQPDLTDFPAFAHARALVFEVLPGDLVYVPAGWFHSVLSSKASLALKFTVDARATWPAKRDRIVEGLH